MSETVKQTFPALLTGLKVQYNNRAPTDLAQAANNGDGQQIVYSLLDEKTDDVAAAAAAPLS